MLQNYYSIMHRSGPTTKNSSVPHVYCSEVENLCFHCVSKCPSPSFWPQPPPGHREPGHRWRLRYKLRLFV